MFYHIENVSTNLVMSGIQNVKEIMKSITVIIRKIKRLPIYSHNVKFLSILLWFINKTPSMTFLTEYACHLHQWDDV